MTDTAIDVLAEALARLGMGCVPLERMQGYERQQFLDKAATVRDNLRARGYDVVRIEE